MSSFEANRLYEIILSIPHLCKVSPSTQIMPQLHILISNCHPLDNFSACQLILTNPLPVQIDLSPEEEELLFVVMVNITIDQAVSLVILMDNIEGLSIPSAK